MHKDSKISKKELEAARKEVSRGFCPCSLREVASNIPLSQMVSPYFIPLEILCNAVVSCVLPPGPTEKKVAEEIKKQWSQIMQRVGRSFSYLSKRSISFRCGQNRLKVLTRSRNRNV